MGIITKGAAANESLLNVGDPLARALEVVRQTALRHAADIATLFEVENGSQLNLAAGFVLLDGKEISLPSKKLYQLQWDSRSPRGLTAKVAITGEPLRVDSLSELRACSEHVGAWDEHVYPQGIDDPQTGFGCLYAVPLRTSQERTPRESVIGVLKIERRCNRPTFDESDRTAFELVAAHLGTILKTYVLARGADEDFARVYSILLRLKRCAKDADNHDDEVETDNAVESMNRLRRRVRKLFDARGAGRWDMDSFFPMLEVRVAPAGQEGSVQSSNKSSPAPVMVHSESTLDKWSSGFAHVPVADEHKKAAVRNAGQWFADDKFEEYRPQLEWLAEQERWELLLDSFYRAIPFGTGGRRGPVGIGPNRFNPFMLASSVQGHIDYLREAHRSEDLSVVIAYDVREFHDLRGVYNPELPNPLLGMTSRDFARLAAESYTANGVRVYILPEESDVFLSTPELSFAIRQLGATAGLNISASHNHPDDNGGKFYNQHGGQEVPPTDELMAKRVENVRHFATLGFDHAKATGLISTIPREIHESYIGMNLRQSLLPEVREARVVFSPLHGTGETNVGEVLKRAGFDVETVEEQATLDGTFPTVPYRAPNPEVQESMERAIGVARVCDGDLVMVCDPDADRIGVCSKVSSGKYRFLTGNEIPIVLTHYKLERLQKQRRLPHHPLVIKTGVTSELVRVITEHFGGVTIGDLLVGFKYHAHVLEQLVTHGRFRGVEARLDDLVIGVEESHGILVTSEVRDKDAAGAAILLAELAAMQRQQGRTVLDYLDDIYRRFGYYAELLTSMVMSGVVGFSDIRKIQNSLRQRPPERIGGLRVTNIVDHWDERGVHGPFLSETDRASRNVLVFELENGGRVIIRPSGTEPKNKIYVEIPSQPLGVSAEPKALADQKFQADRTAQALADDFTRMMLAIIGVNLPDYALRISALVPLAQRLDFVSGFLPGLESRAQSLCKGETSEQEISKWIDLHLSAYGHDARGLVQAAFQEYLNGQRAEISNLSDNEARRHNKRLDAMGKLFDSPAS